MKTHHPSSKHKWGIVLLLFFTVIIAFIGRLSTSVALAEIGDELVWSKAQTGYLGGLLMGIFLVSYGFSNILFSPGIDKYGSKRVLLACIIGCSASVLMGAVVGHIYTLFLLSRIFLGISQGVIFPVAAKLIASWFIGRERGRANSFFIVGASVGVASAPLLMAPIIHGYDWRMAFYVVAVAGFLLTVPIALFIQDTPTGETHVKRRIDTGEVFRRLLKDNVFKQVTVGFTAVNTIWWGATLWVPTYLEETQGIVLGQTPYVAALPYTGAIAGLLTGTWISDKRGNPNTVIAFSLTMTAIMITILAFTPLTSIAMAVFLLMLVFFFGQLAPPIFFTKLQNSIETHELGSAAGLMNGISNTFGVMGPVSVGVVVGYTGSYSYGLLTLAVVAAVGATWFRRCCRPPAAFEKVI